VWSLPAHTQQTKTTTEEGSDYDSCQSSNQEAHTETSRKATDLRLQDKNREDHRVQAEKVSLRSVMWKIPFVFLCNVQVYDVCAHQPTHTHKINSSNYDARINENSLLSCFSL